MSTIQENIKRFQQGHFALLTGAPECGAIVVSPAATITTGRMNTLIDIAGTEVHVALSPARADAFILQAMNTERSSDARSPEDNFHCISVEAREGVTTGISAADRAKTVSILGEDIPHARKLVRPGHVFPMQVRQGGTLVRNALPEGAYDLVTLCHGSDAAAYMHILNEHGEHPSPDEIESLARQHQIPLFMLSDIIQYRLRNEQLVTRIAKAKLPTKYGGELTSYIYQSVLYPGEHIALVKGAISPDTPVLTRVQPEFTFGDVFGGNTPNSRSKIQQALEELQHVDSGVFVYLRRSDIGELEKQVRNWEGAVKRPAAALMQEYGIGAQILRDLGVSKIELLTTKKQHITGLEAFGLEITNQRIMDQSCHT